jgi:hypothetical protein
MASAVINRAPRSQPPIPVSAPTRARGKFSSSGFIESAGYLSVFVAFPPAPRRSRASIV